MPPHFLTFLYAFRCICSQKVSLTSRMRNLCSFISYPAPVLLLLFWSTCPQETAPVALPKNHLALPQKHIFLHFYSFSCFFFSPHLKTFFFKDSQQHWKKGQKAPISPSATHTQPPLLSTFPTRIVHMYS